MQVQQHTIQHLDRQVNKQVQCESKKSHSQGFLTLFPNSWEFLVQILHANNDRCKYLNELSLLLKRHLGVSIFQLVNVCTCVRQTANKTDVVPKMSSKDLLLRHSENMLKLICSEQLLSPLPKDRLHL